MDDGDGDYIRLFEFKEKESVLHSLMEEFGFKSTQ